MSGIRVFGLGGGTAPEKAPALEITKLKDLDMEVAWEATEDAVGYNILWGYAPDKLYHSYLSYLVYRNQPGKIARRGRRIGALIKDDPVYVRLDVFNESGITEGIVMNAGREKEVTRRQCMTKHDFNQDWNFSKEGGESSEAVTLPHDAMIFEKRDPGSPGGSASAYFPGGIYVYEKTFNAPEAWSDQCVAFQFEGVYRNAKVYINDKEAGGRPYGYIPFFVNVDDLLNYGGTNTIRVIADNSKTPNSRWYSGSGIYRPVWLWTGAKTHINIEGVKIATLSYSPARVNIKTSHNFPHRRGSGGRDTVQG